MRLYKYAFMVSEQIGGVIALGDAGSCSCRFWLTLSQGLLLPVITFQNTLIVYFTQFTLRLRLKVCPFFLSRGTKR